MNNIDLKQLKDIAQICRKYGINAIKIDGLELNMTETSPEPRRRSSKKKTTQNQVDPITGRSLDDQQEQELTEDQLLFYSVNDLPGNV